MPDFSNDALGILLSSIDSRLATIEARTVALEAHVHSSLGADGVRTSHETKRWSVVLLLLGAIFSGFVGGAIADNVSAEVATIPPTKQDRLLSTPVPEQRNTHGSQ